MTNDLYNVRHQELSPRDAALLWRFTQAYRPHDTPETWQQLKERGLARVADDSILDEIYDQYEEEVR
jgi:hypothetical protein